MVSKPCFITRAVYAVCCLSVTLDCANRAVTSAESGGWYWSAFFATAIVGNAYFAIRVMKKGVE